MLAAATYLPHPSCAVEAGTGLFALPTVDCYIGFVSLADTPHVSHPSEGNPLALGKRPGGFLLGGD